MACDGPGAAPPASDADFGSLFERARGAHAAEVEGLRHEVRGLRRELLAAHRQLGERPAAGSCKEDTLPEVRQSTDDQERQSIDDQARTTNSRAARSSVSSSLRSSLGSWQQGSGSGLGHATTRRQQERERLALERGRLWVLVTRPAFEAAVAVVILANALVLVLEAQYKSFSLATSTGHGSAVGESAEVWPLAENVFDVLSWTFGTVFLLELVLKIAGLRLDFFTDAWNYLDAAVVLMWLSSELLHFSANAQFLRIVRLARVVRLVRLLKWMKTHHSDGLFMMTTALTSSISITVWCFLFVLVVHSLLALGMNQFLHVVYFDSGSPKAREQAMVYEYFGSFSRAFFTMVEMTFGNFVVPIRVLMEQVHEAFIVYAVVHKTILGFGVLGVLNAVFVQETFKAASLDDNLMVRQQKKKEDSHQRRMLQLFDEADIDGNGTLDKDEWMAVCQDEWVRAWLSSQEIKAEDALSLFELIDDGDGKLTAEEIIKGTASLKGVSAMMRMVPMVHRIDTRVKNVCAELLFAQHPVATERL